MDGQQTPFKTFQAAANLGLRAGQKLREMARREEEEEVKTNNMPQFLLPGYNLESERDLHDEDLGQYRA